MACYIKHKMQHFGKFALKLHIQNEHKKDYFKIEIKHYNFRQVKCKNVIIGIDIKNNEITQISYLQYPML